MRRFSNKWHKFSTLLAWWANSAKRVLFERPSSLIGRAGSRGYDEVWQVNVQISAILPMYNEEEAATKSVERVCAELAKTGRSFELLCVNDGSSDDTGAVVSKLAEQDSRVRLLELSRNFGKEAAMAAGLSEARGQAVLLMDADLQHPPELIPEMLARWADGYDVVEGIKESRGREGLIYRLLAGVFNRLMGGAAKRNFQGASDFKLLDRQVVDALLMCPERNRFFRGLVAWVGFRTTEVGFFVQERVAGKSSWSRSGLVRYSLRNLLAFSALPLRLVASVGFLALILAGLLAVWTLYRYLRGDSLAGFPTVILLQLMLGGLLLTSVGIIALYLAEMYDELKRRPTYLLRVPWVDPVAARAHAALSAPKPPEAS
jgi:dolichol-phosphate mannosyltransferase